MNWPRPVGKEPLEFRRKPLAKSARLLACSNWRRKSGLGQAAAQGASRGIALVNNIGSFTAQIAEVSVSAGPAANAFTASSAPWIAARW